MSVALTEASPGKDDAPWHKAGLPLAERMLLAQGRPLARRVMAALGQQDCRQCGYDCETYANAVASFAEARLNLCVPGGKDTSRMLGALLAENKGGEIAFDAEAYQRELDAAKAPPPRDLRPGRDRDNPIAVSVKSRRRLNGPASEKATYHVEIDLAQTGLDFVPGDAFGIYPQNDPTLVDAIIAAIGAPAESPVTGGTLRQVLIADRSLGAAPDALFALIAGITRGDLRDKASLLAAGDDPDGDAATLDVLAAIKKFGGPRLDPEAFVASLDPLQPRLYSIASSLAAEQGVVALTVDHVRYRVADQLREGVASSWLAERALPGGSFRAFVQRAPHFKLPENDDAPIVMVGPGTGIAPYRAFLHERRARGAKGPAWLFFGHRNEANDFFYEEELRQFRADGTLGKLSLAWSRDGETKTYIQHRMIAEGEELWDWLYDGAHIYVCGDAKRMAADVERALVEIVADYGNRDEEAALAYIENLKRSGRYQMDVY